MLLNFRKNYFAIIFTVSIIVMGVTAVDLFFCHYDSISRLDCLGFGAFKRNCL